jgi:hypothetical protein
VQRVSRRRVGAADELWQPVAAVTEDGERIQRAVPGLLDGGDHAAHRVTEADDEHVRIDHRLDDPQGVAVDGGQDARRHEEGVAHRPRRRSMGFPRAGIDGARRAPNNVRALTF